MCTPNWGLDAKACTVKILRVKNCFCFQLIKHTSKLFSIKKDFQFKYWFMIFCWLCLVFIYFLLFLLIFNIYLCTKKKVFLHLYNLRISSSFFKCFFLLHFGFGWGDGIRAYCSPGLFLFAWKIGVFFFCCYYLLLFA